MTNPSSENNIASLPSSSVFNSAQTLNIKSISNCLNAWYNPPDKQSEFSEGGFGHLGLFVCFKVELSEQSYTH